VVAPRHNDRGRVVWFEADGAVTGDALIIGGEDECVEGWVIDGRVEG